MAKAKSELETFLGKDHKHYWRLKKGGKIVAVGGEGFATASSAKRAYRKASETMVAAVLAEQIAKPAKK